LIRFKTGEILFCSLFIAALDNYTENGVEITG